MKTIGILGGMGPRSTVEFEQRLLEKLDGSDQNLPKIICINDGSIPDRSDFLLGKGIDPAPRITRNALQLQATGANFICLPCNTACVPEILTRVQARLTIPIINLPQEVVDEVLRQGVNSLLVLGTGGTIKSGIYEKICGSKGINCQVPSLTLQELIQKVIALTKAGNDLTAKKVAAEARNLIAETNCQAVVLGCTELSLVANSLVPENIQALDTLDILVEAAVRYANTKELVNDAR